MGTQQNIQELGNNREWFKLHIVGVPEIKYRKNRAEEIFEEMMAKNFSKLIDPRSSESCNQD